MQHKKLQELLQYMARYSPFYQEMFAKNNIDISTVNTVADLQRFPVTVKEDLQQRNYEFLCVRDKIIEYVLLPEHWEAVTIALTENDLEGSHLTNILPCHVQMVRIRYLPADVNARPVHSRHGLLFRYQENRCRYLRLGGCAFFNGYHSAVKTYSYCGVPSFIIKLIQFAKNMN
jgi:phenylacetate-CoA ligase